MCPRAPSREAAWPREGRGPPAPLPPHGSSPAPRRGLRRGWGAGGRCRAAAGRSPRPSLPAAFPVLRGAQSGWSRLAGRGRSAAEGPGDSGEPARSRSAGDSVINSAGGGRRSGEGAALGQPARRGESNGAAAGPPRIPPGESRRRATGALRLAAAS